MNYASQLIFECVNVMAEEDLLNEGIGKWGRGTMAALALGAGTLGAGENDNTYEYDYSAFTKQPTRQEILDAREMGTLTVKMVGDGENSGAAIQDAIRKAVQYAAGQTFSASRELNTISSDTESKTTMDSMSKSATMGNIHGYKVLSVNRLDDGLWRANVLVKVRNPKLFADESNSKDQNVIKNRKFAERGGMANNVTGMSNDGNDGWQHGADYKGGTTYVDHYEDGGSNYNYSMLNQRFGRSDLVDANSPETNYTSWF